MCYNSSDVLTFMCGSAKIYTEVTMLTSELAVWLNELAG